MNIVGIDAIGCLLAAPIAAAPQISKLIDPSLRARWPIVGALTVTGLVFAASRSAKTAAVINCGWVLVCLVGIRKVPTPLGKTLVGATALCDGFMAGWQWRI